MMNLLDREEIGSLIIDDVILYILRHLYRYRDTEFSHKVTTTHSPCISQDKYSPDFQLILSSRSFPFSCSYTTSPFWTKIIKSANLLFDQLEPRTLWSHLERLLERELSHPPSIGTTIESILLVGSLIDVIPLKETEIQTIYLPSILCAIISGMKVRRINSTRRRIYHC